MLEWKGQMPQTKGWYLWIDIDWGLSAQDLVHVCLLTDYREENRHKIGKTPREPRSTYLYKNDKGEDMVIVWGVEVPYIDDKNQVYVDGWAEFNWPDCESIPPRKPIIPKALPMKE